MVAELDTKVESPPANAIPAGTTEETVRADSVKIVGNAQQVEARNVTVENGGIATARGTDMKIDVTNGGIGALAAEHAEVSVTDGGIGAVAARHADVHDASIGLLAAGDIKLEGNSRVAFDMRAGVIFGLIVGSILSATMTFLRLMSAARANATRKHSAAGGTS